MTAVVHGTEPSLLDVLPFGLVAMGALYVVAGLAVALVRRLVKRGAHR